MGKNPEDEIQKKLIELELSIKDEEAKHQPAAVQGAAQHNQMTTAGASEGSSLISRNANSASATTPAAYEDMAFKADLQTFGGLALIGLSVFWLCTHIKLWAGAAGGMMGMFGPHVYVGVYLLPIFVGIGMLFYNWRSKLAQLITAGGIGLLLFMILMQLQFSFAPVSMLELILMIMPVCAGSAFLLKGHYKRVALKQIKSE